MHVSRAARAVCRVAVTSPGATSQLNSARAAVAASSLDQWCGSTPSSRRSLRRRPLSSVALDGDTDGESTTNTAGEKMAQNNADKTEQKKRPARRRVPRERPPPITLTDRAAAHLTQLLASKPDKVGVRLGVKRRGCNGMSYTMKYTDEKPKGDEEIVIQTPSILGVPGLQFEEGGKSSEAGAGLGHQPAVDASVGGSGGDAVVRTRLFVDPMATLYIAGTVMDWEETELSSEFTFRNPNAKGECGCGESFNV